MMPTDWTPVRRADGEQVGWLAPDGGSGRVLPLLLTGTQLAPAGAEAEAADLLPPGLLPAGEPGQDWVWQPVVLVESCPTGCTVRPEWPAPGETGRAVLPVPVGDLLREQPPEG
ncbi:hypothetical protein [Blastococcus goldschmidtiae]|uniref:Uncharacterized protein n=1 Tax=Blastococcus goldschmidtiae TaxID=3075546 RepID=A0ABU2KAQ3_9ACTN|nr:hypothetical protein [Blastococcus sp. DSM 46792]MDT0277265.1 hypothetical protein [Blastococcus sp. DSM 46792]